MASEQNVLISKIRRAMNSKRQIKTSTHALLAVALPTLMEIAASARRSHSFDMPVAFALIMLCGPLWLLATIKRLKRTSVGAWYNYLIGLAFLALIVCIWGGWNAAKLLALVAVLVQVPLFIIAPRGDSSEVPGAGGPGDGRAQ